MRVVSITGLLLALAIPVTAAVAHVELKAASAPAGSDYRAVFTVEHGCAGAATTAIRIRLDDRITAAAATAKTGWSAEVTRAAVKQPDGTSKDTAREVSWTGGTIPANVPSDFELRVTLPDAPPGTVIYFPVVQECGSTVVRWIEMPLAGENPETLDAPAPFVTLTKGTAAPASAR